jgi:hypothetical protein
MTAVSSCLEIWMDSPELFIMSYYFFKGCCKTVCGFNLLNILVNNRGIILSKSLTELYT